MKDLVVVCWYLEVDFQSLVVKIEKVISFQTWDIHCITVIIYVDNIGTSLSLKLVILLLFFFLINENLTAHLYFAVHTNQVLFLCI